MTTIELNNPSAFHPLRIYSQDRARNTFDKAPPAKAATPKRETRAELEARGSEITLKPTKIMTKQGAVMRDIPTPLWQAEGAETLAEWCTGILDKMADDARKAPSVDVPKVQRVVDSWGERRPYKSVPPGGTILLALDEHQRLVLECDEEISVSVAHTDTIRTVRLRQLDGSGVTMRATYITPVRDSFIGGKATASASITAGKTSAAAIELQPT
jgi:hypothetical protein